jgi:hypothetical protein
MPQRNETHMAYYSLIEMFCLQQFYLSLRFNYKA